MLQNAAPEELARIAPLFSGYDDTLILSCLQGRMGNAFLRAGDAELRSAQIVTGDFCFFGGAPDAELAAHIPADFRSEALLIIDPPPGWLPLLAQAHLGALTRDIRFAFEKQADFRPERLRKQAAPPQGYTILPIDGALYRQALADGWCCDLVSQFSSEEDYLRRGMGRAAAREGELVAGASSYTIYDGGIEIEIDTKKEYRRKGLATACAAALILDCIARGLFPSWDAANPVSCHLAESLGYRFSREYPVYELRCDFL